jgi:hypothetical protein
MRLTRLGGLALGASMLMAAAPSSAQEKEFGSQGVLHMGAASLLELEYQITSPPGGGSSTNSLALYVQPEVEYFVIDGLSVGGVLGFGYFKPDQGDSTTLFAIGPTVGYNVWLTPGSLSLWPQARFLYQHYGASSTGTSTAASTTVTFSRTNIQIAVPLEVHPVKHFDFGIGPYVAFDLSASASTGNASADYPKTTSFGLEGEIGGWL